ncbi:hypothetical protein ONZ45_g2390 [Pleurotus djamor]|nr:hypothetical protein ONZ45_g2390 [Pleurotus djamor]
MADVLPIDMNNPQVRDYLSLIRLQVLTPLSLLINIGSVLICSLIVDPSIRGIIKLYPSPITPRPSVIAAYVLLIYAGQIGYCILLTAARKPETKDAMVKGVGISLVLANWIMAFWAVTWVFRWFIASTVLLSMLTLLLIYSNINLLVYHAPTSGRPIDTALIHAPMRFFLILPMSIMLEYSLFITLGLIQTPTSPGIPRDYDRYAFEGFLAVFFTNLVSIIVIAVRRDIVWCIAAVWICISVWSERPKASSVYITVLAFTALHPLALIGGFIYRQFFRRKRVALVTDDDALYRAAARENGRDGNTPDERRQRGANEIDPEELWG